MKKALFVVVLFALAAAPAAFGCETCTWAMVTGKAMCKSGVSSGMGSCWVLPDYSDCEGTWGCDVNSGNPGADGPVSPTGGGDCQSTFYCPPGCMSCSSGVKY